MMEIEHNNDIVDSPTEVGPERTHPPCYAPLVRCAVEAKCCACAPMCATSPPADQRMTTRCRWCLPSANARPCCDHIPHALQTVDSIHRASSMVTAADQARFSGDPSQAKPTCQHMLSQLQPFQQQTNRSFAGEESYHPIPALPNHPSNLRCLVRHTTYLNPDALTSTAALSAGDLQRHRTGRNDVGCYQFSIELIKSLKYFLHLKHHLSWTIKA